MKHRGQQLPDAPTRPNHSAPAPPRSASGPLLQVSPVQALLQPAAQVDNELLFAIGTWFPGGIYEPPSEVLVATIEQLESDYRNFSHRVRWPIRELLPQGA